MGALLGTVDRRGHPLACSGPPVPSAALAFRLRVSLLAAACPVQSEVDLLPAWIWGLCLWNTVGKSYCPFPPTCLLHWLTSDIFLPKSHFFPFSNIFCCVPFRFCFFTIFLPFAQLIFKPQARIVPWLLGSCWKVGRWVRHGGGLPLSVSPSCTCLIPV